MEDLPSWHGLRRPRLTGIRVSSCLLLTVYAELEESVQDLSHSRGLSYQVPQRAYMIGARAQPAGSQRVSRCLRHKITTVLTSRYRSIHGLHTAHASSPPVAKMKIKTTASSFRESRSVLVMCQPRCLRIFLLRKRSYFQSHLRSVLRVTYGSKW